MQTFSEEQLMLKHPFSMVVAGPRRSGKTEFTKKLILESEQKIDIKIDKFVWYFANEQSELTKELSHKVIFQKELPEHNLEQEFFGNENVLVVIDHLMEESNKRDDIKSLFTRGRHLNVSVIFLTQNLFHRGKNNRDVSLNTDYMVLFKNPRDVTIVSNLAKQMDNTKFMKWAYNDATREPFSYLLIDMRSDTDDRLRFRAKFFDKYQIVYEKKRYK